MYLRNFLQHIQAVVERQNQGNCLSKLLIIKKKLDNRLQWKNILKKGIEKKHLKLNILKISKALKDFLNNAGTAFYIKNKALRKMQFNSEILRVSYS